MGRGNYLGRYGLTGRQVQHLRDRWRKNAVNGTWEDFDAFVKWASETGYEDGVLLRKFNEEKPHGPDNSFWATRSQCFQSNGRPAGAADKKPRKKRAAVVKPKPEPDHPPVRDLCAVCETPCKHRECGCEEWFRNWQRYWNANIHRKVEIRKRMVFQYEHPDLQKEGIVFEHTT